MIINLMSIVLAAGFYSAAFWYFLGLRIMRNSKELKDTRVFTAILVGASIFTGVIGLEGFAFLFVDKQIAARFFSVAGVAGFVAVMLSSAAVVSSNEKERPSSVALLNKKLLKIGLYIGNPLIAIANYLCFYVAVPVL